MREPNTRAQPVIDMHGCRVGCNECAHALSLIALTHRIVNVFEAVGLEDDVRPDDAKLHRLVDRHLLGERLDVAIERRRAKRGLALDVLDATAVRPLEEQAHIDELASAALR